MGEPHALCPSKHPVPCCFCLADALMKKAFGSSSFNANAFLTSLLIHMGLLKVRPEAVGPGGGGCTGGCFGHTHPPHRTCVLQGPVTHTVLGLAPLKQPWPS